MSVRNPLRPPIPSALGCRCRRWTTALLLAGTLAGITPSPSQAQVLIGLLFGDKVSTPTFHLGMNVGANFMGLADAREGESRLGFLFGLVGEWQFSDGWYLQGETLPLSFRGARNVPLDLAPPPPGFQSAVDFQDVTFRLWYFEGNVLLKRALLGRRLHLGLGPSLGVLTSAEAQYEGIGTQTERAVSVQEDVVDDLERLEFAGIAHAEWKFAPHPFAASVSLRYLHGFTEIRDTGDAFTPRNRGFQLFLTLPMGKLPVEGES